MRVLTPVPLTQENFAPFGQVIEADEARSFLINEGTTRRYHALANVDVALNGGQPIISIFEGQRRSLPLELKMVEQHPLGSQAFVPMEQKPWLVVVADAVEKPGPEHLHAFLARGDQGVQYAKGVWHHPLLILAETQNFLVVDRKKSGENSDANLVEYWFEDELATIEVLGLLPV
jgi:ureidoglycolate lyase